ncbi:adhesion G-protein coupled receptor G7 [Antechinus flavipes]|uniref:adhesion G-protein coupled receptor G7 n=1 Tax=Antechinus flavipes TaxID=38775 RepID=UPI002235885B|nr:adhesion G-protein coupled receptor G7 [Antechinus flavipes]
MSSPRTCNLRLLVGMICMFITTILLGLCIWVFVTIMKTETSLTPSFNFCKNGGTWRKDGCFCPEQWTGLRCTIVNFCNKSSFGQFSFDIIVVHKFGPSIEKCGKDTPNAGLPKASRYCNKTIYGDIILGNVSEVNCNQSLETLAAQVENIPEQSLNISMEVQLLTSDTNKLTAENVSSAITVVQQIFNQSRNATDEAKKIAVTTVSQLLDAKEAIFENSSSFVNLTKELETYSSSLMNKSIVQPNIALQSVDLPTENTSQPVAVLFSVQRGTNNILDSKQIQTDINKTLQLEDQMELQVLINTIQDTHKKLGFVLYQNNKFFQSKTFTSTTNFSQRIIAGRVADANDPEAKNTSVEIIFKPRYNESQFLLNTYACVFWNFEKDNWDTFGCKKKPINNSQFVGCQCNHTTNFAVLLNFKRKYNYPDSLNKITKFGCGLSIAGLALTIIFQITTRKLRKTSITWVFVSFCTSMLIFNILFLLGIENSNKNENKTVQHKDDNVLFLRDITSPKNHKCTVMAVLLHYFLLVTFTWTGLNAVQLYFLLLRAMRPLPQHFTLFLSLIGWGVPAIIVSLTVGIIYPLKGEFGYRREEICWLAIPDSYVESPLLWSLILPVLIILITNIVIFVIISVKVLWRRNENLTSTKRSSFTRKILSTLSIVVVLGLTWILGYLTLIMDDDIKIIFNYLFCIFNSTQGLQIFIFYTVKTKVFQNKVSDIFKSISSTTGKMKMPSMKSISLHAQVYEMIRSFPSRIEHFRLFDPSPTSEKTIISESNQSNSCHETVIV